MITNFFQNIADLKTPGIWKIVIHTDDDGNFTVSELFTAECGDKAINKIIPMNFSGTAQELGEGFFTAIATPVAETAGLITNLEKHLKSIEEARIASKLEAIKKELPIKVRHQLGMQLNTAFLLCTASCSMPEKYFLFKYLFRQQYV